MASVKTKITRQKPDAARTTARNYEKALKNGVRMAGMMVRATAVQSITNGSPSGIIYEKYNPRRTHTASSPGNPPAADTGYLHSNIHFVLDSDGLGASVESRAYYSEALEFGTSRMQARPFLQPAIEENRPKIKQLMANLAKGAN
jgi:HK97 gp10 family phage protein